MRRYVFLVFCFVLLWTVPVSASDLREAAPTARSWLVIDERTGTPLRFNRQRERRPIASTTKLLTALAVIRRGDLDRTLRVSAVAAGQPASKLGLRTGERWTRRDLLHALLMQSANDSATALAEDASGSEVAFCRHLTALAKSLGCTNTRIRRASGLPASGQGATAADLAIIADAALANPQLKAILARKSRRIRSAGGRRLTVVNKNRLRSSSKGRILGKTGYTRRAQRCFAGRMVIDGRPCTIVILGSQNLWGDLIRLREWTKQFATALRDNRARLSAHQVKKWQRRLQQAGLAPGPVDGVWGAKTQRAYLDWELKRGQRPDGRVG